MILRVCFQLILSIKSNFTTITRCHTFSNFTLNTYAIYGTLRTVNIYKMKGYIFDVKINNMRLRNITGARDYIAENNFVIHDAENCKGKWNSEIFKNNNPVQIEIGMGKGRFIMELASKNPDINFVGIEKYSSVLLRAIQKMEALDSPLPNLVFIRMDAEDIEKIFDKGEVDKIYLNFSDPWPKDRHAKRRLPSRQFLARYDTILKQDGFVEFKTDNIDLFNFGLEEIGETEWKIKGKTFDLHNDPSMNEGNIMTEYEERFSSKGNPICKYVIYR